MTSKHTFESVKKFEKVVSSKQVGMQYASRQFKLETGKMVRNIKQMGFLTFATFPFPNT